MGYGPLGVAPPPSPTRTFVVTENVSTHAVHYLFSRRLMYCERSWTEFKSPWVRWRFRKSSDLRTWLTVIENHEGLLLFIDASLVLLFLRLRVALVVHVFSMRRQQM